MQSGAPIPVGNITRGQVCVLWLIAVSHSLKGRKVWYDQIVNQTNCADQDDTLNCLRSVPYEDLKTVINRTPNYYDYTSLDLVWVPRADGDFLPDNPQRLVLDGTVADIPIVSGAFQLQSLRKILPIFC